MSFSSLRLSRFALVACASAALLACSPKEEATAPVAAPAPSAAPAASAATAAAPASAFMGVLMLAAQPADAPAADATWTRVASLTDVSWKWGADKVAENKFSMKGVLPPVDHKIAEYGEIDVTVEGDASTFKVVTLEGHDLNAKVLDDKEIGASQLTRVMTDCDNDMASMKTLFYKVELPGYKPFFAHFEMYGGTGGNTSIWRSASDIALLLAATPATGNECKLQG